MRANHFVWPITVLSVCMLFAFRPDQTRFDKITVQEFEMVDDHGVRRASVKLEEGGAMVFRMMDQQGIIRVKLSADENGSALVLLDGDTEPALHLQSKTGKVGIALTVDGKRRDL